MKLIVNIIIVLITFLALIIIVVIGLDVQSLKWCYFANAKDINIILINLSYSYIAGAIFYLLVTAIPFYLRSKKMNLVIKDRLNTMSANTQTIIFAYDPSSIDFTIEQIKEINLDRNDEKELLNLLQKSTVFDISNVAKQIYPEAKTIILFTVKQSLQVIDKSIEEILNYYLDYLSEEQILLLNKIKNSAFKKMISTSTDNDFNKMMFSQAEVINSLATDFVAFWKDVKKLQSISK